MRKAIGISPMIDMAFKKTFGTPENKLALISLLNAILKLLVPIVDLTIINPYNLQDFETDKLSILDSDRGRFGKIHALQEILGVPRITDEALRLMSLEELAALASELQQSVRSRLSP
jgi:hypothetical protein